MKQMTYGDSMAIMVLAAERMGLGPRLVSQATFVLEGKAVHVTTHKAIETEAIRIQDELRADQGKVNEANAHAEAVKAEFGFSCAANEELAAPSP